LKPKKGPGDLREKKKKATIIPIHSSKTWRVRKDNRSRSDGARAETPEKENTWQRIKKTSSGVWDPYGKKALDLKQITKITTPKKVWKVRRETQIQETIYWITSPVDNRLRRWTYEQISDKKWLQESKHQNINFWGAIETPKWQIKKMNI
jgi:hypothetical protein